MIVVSDALGAGETNYPFQLGNPFPKGAIPHAPDLLINGVAVSSQADVKNRYPDGSAEFAVISAIVPHPGERVRFSEFCGQSDERQYASDSSADASIAANR